jgi:hypothetical protein
MLTAINNLKNRALASAVIPIEHKTLAMFARKALPMIMEHGGRRMTNIIAIMRGTTMVSVADNGSCPFDIITMVVDTKATTRTMGMSMRTTVVAPRALEGVVSLQDQQYTIKRVAAPDTSMRIHNANPVDPVNGTTLKICKITM